jgi:hypothetical protein
MGRITWSDIDRWEPEEKIHSFDSAVELIHGNGGLRHSGIPIVGAFGVMDVLHQAHFRYIHRAKIYGLVAVGLENDESVRVNKGKSRPISNINERMYSIAAIACVGLVFPFDDAPVYSDPGAHEAYVARLRKLNTWIAVKADDPNLAAKRRAAAEAHVPVMPVWGQWENSTTRMLRDVGYQE